MRRFRDKSSGEAEFRIERDDSSSESFAQIATVGANTTTFTDESAPRGLLLYRVRACNAGGCSAYGNLAFVFKP